MYHWRRGEDFISHVVLQFLQAVISHLPSVSIKPVAEFNPHAEVGASLATLWNDWLDDFEMFLVASGITDNTRKRALLSSRTESQRNF